MQIENFPPPNEEPNKIFRPRKLKTDTIESIYDDLNASDELPNKKSWRMRSCGKQLRYLGSGETGKYKLIHAHFCHVRLCPMCQWRRHMKVFSQLSKVTTQLDADGYKFIFATFTIKNVVANDLRNALQQLSKGLHLFLKRKHFRDIILGGFRTTEVTYNKEMDTWHPHIHMLLAVPKNYAVKGDGNYITQKEFQSQFKSAMCLQYDPIVDVKRIKKNSDTFRNAVEEVSKYVTKVNNYIEEKPFVTEEEREYSRRNVKTLDEALHGLRLCSFFGVMKEIHKKLNLDDPNDGDLLCFAGDEEIDDTTMYVLQWHQWFQAMNEYNLIREDVYTGTEIKGIIADEKANEEAQKAARKKRSGV